MSLALADRRAAAWTAAVPQARGAGPLGNALTYAGIVLIFVLSDMALARFGFNYGEGGGIFLEKVHPGTWLLMLALAAIVARKGPLIVLDHVVAARGLLIFALVWVLLLGWVIVVRKTPFTPLIDTFFLPMLIFVILGEVGNAMLRRIAVTLHVILVANALIGIVEYVSGWRLTPFMLGSTVVPEEWRSTALFGHPLANAAATGAYLVALGVGAGRDLPRLMVPAIMALQLVAMVAFGGRSSFAIALLLLLIGGWRLALILRGASFNPLFAVVALLGAPVLIAVATYAAQTGFFDLFADRIADDSGSAQSRVVMLRLFGLLSWSDIVLGPDPAYIVSLQHLEGIELGIESFWIGFILNHGLAMALLFFAGFGAFCCQLIASTRSSAGVLLFYLIAISGSVSLSAKTVSFGMVVAILATMLRRPEEER